LREENREVVRMMLNYADNALMAKVRALYGSRLREEDYQHLLASKTVAEVAAYLKSDTLYADTLSEVKEELIPRGQLETFVRRHSLNLYTRLIRFSYNDRFFLSMYMMENEIRQLLLAIRFLNAGSMDRYIVALPVYLDKYLSIDLFALAKVRDYDQLLEIVAHSPYYDCIARYRPITSDKPVDIIACEHALLEHFYNTVFEMVEKDYSGATRDDLRAIIGTQVDFHNLQVVYRLRRYFGYSPDRVRKSMLHIKTAISPTLAYDPILYATGREEINEALRNAYVTRKFRIDSSRDSSWLSERLSRSRKALCHKTFRFSTKPMVIVLSYMFLLEIEVQNIVNIIEGIRYQIPAEEIRNLLII
jgi:V/A-type H+-transporting ATPase subunit C